MARIGKIVKVSVKNNLTGSVVEYNSSTTPMKSTVGNHWFNTINYRGIKKLQDAGFKVYSERDCISVLQQLFAGYNVTLTEEDFGRGELWNTAELRNAYSVSIDGTPFVPVLKEKDTVADFGISEPISMPAPARIPALADLTPAPMALPAMPVGLPQMPKAVMPQLPQLPTAQLPQIPVAQVPQPVGISAEEKSLAEKVKGYLAKGVTAERVFEALAGKIGKEKAERVFMAVKTA